MKRYTIYVLGPNGPKSDVKVRDFWTRKRAKAAYNPAAHEAVFDNWTQRWV